LGRLDGETWNMLCARLAAMADRLQSILPSMIKGAVQMFSTVSGMRTAERLRVLFTFKPIVLPLLCETCLLTPECLSTELPFLDSASHSASCLPAAPVVPRPLLWQKSPVLRQSRSPTTVLHATGLLPSWCRSLARSMNCPRRRARGAKARRPWPIPASKRKRSAAKCGQMVASSLLRPSYDARTAAAACTVLHRGGHGAWPVAYVLNANDYLLTGSCPARGR
jgi:hypothetical protein